MRTQPGRRPVRIRDDISGQPIAEAWFDEGISHIGNTVPPLFMRSIAKHIRCRISVMKFAAGNVQTDDPSVGNYSIFQNGTS